MIPAKKTILHWAAGLTLIGAAAVCAAKPAPLGKPAPDFSLPSLNSNDTMTLSAFRGKVVLLDFWASWCLPCKRLMPLLGEMKDRLPDLEILALSVDVDRNKALSFQRSVEPGLKAAYDANQKTSESYGVTRMPTCFLIDKKGRLRFRHDGYTEQDLKKLEREAKLLLAEPG